MNLKQSLVHIALGSNVGEAQHNLGMARKLIREQAGELVKTSTIIVTLPWGNIKEQNNFYNQMLLVKTILTPQLLINKLLMLEKQMGRKREIKWGPRIIDLDIIYFGNRKINNDKLVVPHPFLQQRKFILFHLNELSPKKMHPLLRKNSAELFKLCEDELGIVKIINDK